MRVVLCYKYASKDSQSYHFGCRRAFLATSVFLPFDSRTVCNSLNFFLVYLFASASFTSSSTIVLFRCDLGRLSALVVPNGVVEGTIVPIYVYINSESNPRITRTLTYREVLGKSFDTLAFTYILSVEAFWIKLVPETQSFDFMI